MKTEKYQNQQQQLPQTGKFIIAQTDAESIIVYQAFRQDIANYAIAHQKFGGSNYSFNRMTWIKPNFMWMMYRSGWGTKPQQERTLALRLTKQGFKTILEQAVHSSFQAYLYPNRMAWKAALHSTEVRLQWDPDHSPTGEKLARRAIQLGIKGQILQTMNDEWLLEIIDCSDFVATQRRFIHSEELIVPFERVIDYSDAPKVLSQINCDIIINTVHQ